MVGRIRGSSHSHKPEALAPPPNAEASASASGKIEGSKSTRGKGDRDRSVRATPEKDSFRGSKSAGTKKHRQSSDTKKASRDQFKKRSDKPRPRSNDATERPGNDRHHGFEHLKQYSTKKGTAGGDQGWGPIG